MSEEDKRIKAIDRKAKLREELTSLAAHIEEVSAELAKDPHHYHVLRVRQARQRHKHISEELSRMTGVSP
jgi:hypothetical protein